VEKQLSIVVPVYNEEANVLPLAEEVRNAFSDRQLNYELIFVDDGSDDCTWEKIIQARSMDPRVRGLRHQKNGGQSAALWTGILASTAPVIATLDGDLQNEPADLPKLLEAMDGCDFVCGVRKKRQDDWLRRVSTKVARKARHWVLKVDFCDTGCAVRVFKREVLKGLFPFNGIHRFLPVLVHSTGARTKEVPINHRQRIAGVSKYGLHNRLWRGIYDLIAVAWYQRRRIGEIPCVECEDHAAAA